METTFENKCEILAEVWLDYREDPEFEDYIKYNDLALPLAWAVSRNVVAKTDKLENFVDEGFALLLDLLSVEDDNYQSLDDLLAGAADNLPDGE